MATEKFDSNKINAEELAKYEKNYSENGLKRKIKKYAKVIGANAIYKVLQLWFVLQKPEVPMTEKALITGAIGYLISPIDFIPDFTPILGYSDDFIAITYALIHVHGYIDDDVKEKSKNMLNSIFGDNAADHLE